MYKKYDHTTQIVSLPGGVKRSNNDIRDDSQTVQARNTPSYCTKLTRDYNSNISCLPGSMMNSMGADRILVKQRKNQTSDIFNSNSGNANGNFNSFNTSNRRVESNRIFGQSNEEKRLIPNPRAQRPNLIRNVFESQISIV